MANPLNMNYSELLSQQLTIYLGGSNNTFFTFNIQGPRQSSGSATTKKVLDALENDTKANFRESITGKVRFQKKWGAWPLCPPPSWGDLEYKKNSDS